MARDKRFVPIRETFAGSKIIEGEIVAFRRQLDT